MRGILFRSASRCVDDWAKWRTNAVSPHDPDHGERDGESSENNHQNVLGFPLCVCECVCVRECVRVGGENSYTDRKSEYSAARDKKLLVSCDMCGCVSLCSIPPPSPNINFLLATGEACEFRTKLVFALLFSLPAVIGFVTAVSVGQGEATRAWP